MEAETDEECVPSNPAFDTSHTDGEEAVKESSVRSRARLQITLTQRATNSTFTWAGVALTNAPQTVIVLHTHCGRKGNKLERRREREREARENESELQKLEVRIM